MIAGMEAAVMQTMNRSDTRSMQGGHGQGTDPTSEYSLCTNAIKLR